MICRVCLTNEAVKHPTFGFLPCLECKARRNNLRGPDTQVEFTSQSIKKERVIYNRDIIQPYRGHEASKEFIDAYPEQARKTFTKKEIKQARNVWK